MNTPQTLDDLTIAKSNRHEEFYFTDIIFLVSGHFRTGIITWSIPPIQVENQLFKVPRRNFAEESEVFANMFKLPLPDGQDTDQDGSSDDRPLRLDGIQKTDFIQLLRVMFHL